MKPAAADAAGQTGASTRTVVLVSEATLFAAALGTGIAFTFVKGSANERYDAATARVMAEVGPDPDNVACSMPVAGCAELAQAEHDRDQAAVIATASFVTAGASAAAFALTYLLWPVAPSPVRVSAGPGSLGLAIRGHF